MALLQPAAFAGKPEARADPQEAWALGVLASAGIHPGPRELARLRRPFNFKETPLSMKLRSGYATQGFRFDERTGLVLDARSHRPLSRLKMDAMEQEAVWMEHYYAIEHIEVLLAHRDPGRALPRAVRLRIAAIARSTPFEPALQAKLLASPLIPSRFSGALKSHALAIRGFFDRQKGLLGKAEAALPGNSLAASLVLNAPLVALEGPFAAPSVVASLPAAHAMVASRDGAPFFNAAERKLSGEVARLIIARLSQNPIGRETLEGFKDPLGRIVLPRIFFLKIDPWDGAVYVPDNRSIVFNSDVAVGLLRPLRPGPEGLAAFLLAHPKALSAFIAKIDVLLVHELTHALQDKRDPFMSEELRGNAPGQDFLSDEIEAFVQENRYFHYKFLANPEVVWRSPWYSFYIDFLCHTRKFASHIVSIYSKAMPSGTASYRTLLDMDSAEQSLAASRLPLGSQQALEEGLRLIGLNQGRSAIEQSVANINARIRGEWKDHVLMRRQAYPVIARLYMEKGLASRGRARADWLKAAYLFSKAAHDGTMMRKLSGLQGR